MEKMKIEIYTNLSDDEKTLFWKYSNCFIHILKDMEKIKQELKFKTNYKTYDLLNNDEQQKFEAIEHDKIYELISLNFPAFIKQEVEQEIFNILCQFIDI